MGKYARRVALDIAAESKRLAETKLGKHPGDRKRTGKFAKSYRVKVIPGTNSFRVDNSAEQAAAIELGAKAHEIHARRVTYLRFIDRHGIARKVKMVRHPGNPAFNLMSDAANTVLKRRTGTFRRV